MRCPRGLRRLRLLRPSRWAAWGVCALFRLLTVALAAIALAGLCFGQWSVAIVLGDFALAAALLAAAANPKDRRRL